MFYVWEGQLAGARLSGFQLAARIPLLTSPYMQKNKTGAGTSLINLAELSRLCHLC